MAASEGQPESAELAGKVRNWLNKTGLPLELDAVMAFRQAGFECSHSALYEDPETKKGREVDFIAGVQHNLGLMRVAFVGECKASDKPWVVLTDRDQEPGYLVHASLGASHPEMVRELDWSGLLQSNAGLILDSMDSGGYAIKQAFSENVDTAFNAAVSVLKASCALIEHEYYRPPRLVFAMPVIVVDAPIYECWVDPSGDIQLKSVDFSQFSFTAHIPLPRTAVIRIVRRERIEGFAMLCSRIAEGLLDVGRDYVKRWLAERGVVARDADSTSGSG